MNVFELALAAAVITMTITRSSLFIPIRRLLKFKIFKCPYCFVHWVSASLALFLSGFWILNTFVIVGLSILPMLLIEHLNTMVERNVLFSKSQSIPYTTRRTL